METRNGELIEKAKKRAREIFNTKRANCAESVFRAIYELVDNDLPPEISALITPLGGDSRYGDRIVAGGRDQGFTF